MRATKCATVIAALIALVAGIAAAWFWWKSSGVEIKPIWPEGEGATVVEPGDSDASRDGIIGGQIDAYVRVGTLNSTAAKLTAISVFFSALASILGVF
jgi:hypothetical protein